MGRKTALICMGFFSILGVGGEQEGEFSQQPRELLAPPTPRCPADRRESCPGKAKQGRGDLWERKGRSGKGKATELAFPMSQCTQVTSSVPILSNPAQSPGDHEEELLNRGRSMEDLMG